MTREDLIAAARCLELGLRPDPAIGKQLGAALLEYATDEDGLPFEFFAGLPDQARAVDLHGARNTICRIYAETLSTSSCSGKATIILDRVSLVDNQLRTPEDFGAEFERFYSQLRALRVGLPEHRQLRKILADP